MIDRILKMPENLLHSFRALKHQMLLTLVFLIFLYKATKAVIRQDNFPMFKPDLNPRKEKMLSLLPIK